MEFIRADGEDKVSFSRDLADALSRSESRHWGHVFHHFSGHKNKKPHRTVRGAMGFLLSKINSVGTNQVRVREHDIFICPEGQVEDSDTSLERR